MLNILMQCSLDGTGVATYINSLVFETALQVTPLSKWTVHQRG